MPKDRREKPKRCIGGRSWDLPRTEFSGRLALAVRPLVAETPLDDWYRIAKRLRWTSLVDVRKTYPHADAVGEFTIFNIGGNKYRLAAYINYQGGKVYVRHVMTREEYSREDWKK